MSRPPAATRLISPIFLGKQSPGKGIGLAGIMYSICCRVLHGDPRSLQPVTRSEFAKCRIRLFSSDARKICRKVKIFCGRSRVGPGDFSRGARWAKRSPGKTAEAKKNGGGQRLLPGRKLYCCGAEAGASPAFFA